MGDVYASDRQITARRTGESRGTVTAVTMMAAFSLVQGLPSYFFTLASGEHAATGFGFTTSLDALLRFLGGLLAGQAAHAFGYAATFARAAAAALCVCLCSLALRPPLSDRGPS